MYSQASLAACHSNNHTDCTSGRITLNEGSLYIKRRAAIYFIGDRIPVTFFAHGTILLGTVVQTSLVKPTFRLFHVIMIEWQECFEGVRSRMREIHGVMSFRTNKQESISIY